MNITEAQIKAIFPNCKLPAIWPKPITDAGAQFQINTPPRMATFIAQIGHESASLNRLEESLNYSAERLRAVWPKRFPDIATAQLYANKPAPLANLVYANRMGNGPPESNEGWTYRGRGLIMLTGKSNYAAAQAGIGFQVLGSPDLLLQPQVAACAAGWFWKGRGCNELADCAPGEDDTEDFEKITRLINGGIVGLPERIVLWKRAQAILGA